MDLFRFRMMSPLCWGAVVALMVSLPMFDADELTEFQAKQGTQGMNCNALLLRPGSGAEYCDQSVCLCVFLSVCLSVCLSASISLEPLD